LRGTQASGFPALFAFWTDKFQGRFQLGSKARGYIAVTSPIRSRAAPLCPLPSILIV